MKDVRDSRWFFVSKTRGWSRGRSWGRGLSWKECCFRVRARVRVDNSTNPNPNPNLKNGIILKKDIPPPRPYPVVYWHPIYLPFGGIIIILETIAITHPNFLSRFSSCSRNISSYVLPKCKRISLNFRAFKSKCKIENTIMTQTNLSCDNSWCACGYVFCLKIKITKVCKHN